MAAIMKSKKIRFLFSKKFGQKRIVYLAYTERN